MSDAETAVADLMILVQSTDQTLIDNRSISVEKGNGGVCTVTFSPVADANGSAQFRIMTSDGLATDVTLADVTITPVNDAPVAADDDMTAVWTVYENIAASLDLSALIANDADVDGDTLTVTGAGPVSAGTLVYSSGQTWAYTSSAEFSGNVTFSYTMSDGALTASGTATIYVTAVDNAPTLTAGTDNVYSCDEDAGSVSLTFTCADPDTALTALRLSVESENPTLIDQRTVSVTETEAGSGIYTVTFSPTENKFGTCELLVSLTDGNSHVTETFEYTVNSVDDAPEAYDDEYTAIEGQTVFLLPQENDADADADLLYIAENGFTAPTGGSLTASGRGLLFTAPAETGDVTFTYTVTDNTYTDTATVTVHVTTADRAALSISETADIVTVAGTEGAAFSFTVTHTGAITGVTAVSGDESLIDSDTFTVTDGENDEWTVAFDAAAPGSATVTVTVQAEDGAVASRTVNVLIREANSAPAAVADLLSATEDTAFVFTAADILANDTDADGDTLTVESLSVVTGAGTGSYLTVSGTTYTYHPAADFHGDVTLSYTVSDGKTVSEAAAVTLRFANVQDRPVGYNNYYNLANQTGEETLNMTAAALLANDYDADGDTLYFAGIAGGPLYGTLTIENGVLTYTRNGVAPTAHGRDSFTYYLSDLSPDDEAYDPAVNRAAATVVIYEQYPHFELSSGRYYTVAEDAAVFTISLPVYEYDGYDGAFVIQSVTSNLGAAAIGAVDYDEDDVCSGSADPFIHTYTPNADANGSERLTYVVWDSNTESATATGYVYITIIPANDAPVFTAAPATGWTADEDGSYSFDIAFSDVDNAAAGLSLSVAVYGETAVLDNKDITVTRDGGSATVTLDFLPDTSGEVSVLVTVSDDMKTVTAVSAGTVMPVDDATVLQDAEKSGVEDVPISIDLSGCISDIDNTLADLTLTVSAQGGHGTAVADGFTVLYTPDFNWYGTDTVTYRVAHTDDAAVYSEATVTFTVTAVNDEPYLYDLQPTEATAEDTPVTIEFTAFDYEDDADAGDDKSSAITFTSSDTALLPVENIVLADYTDENKSITVTPAENMNGECTVTVRITDSDGSYKEASFHLTVTAVNDAPVGTADSATTAEDTAVTIDVLANDTDVEDSASDEDDLELRVSAVSACTNGIAVNNGDGTIQYTPAANYFGQDSFTYTLADSAGATAEVTVTVTVTAVNDAPALQNDTAAVREGQTVSIPVLGNDSDVENDTLTVTGATGYLDGASVTIEADGTLTYTAPDDIGSGESITDTFTYTVSDGQDTASATVTVTVEQVNDLPVIADGEGNDHVSGGGSWLMTEDVAAGFTVNISDAETAGDKLLFTLSSDGQALVADADISVTATADGNKLVTITPRANAFGTFNLTVTVNDGTDETELVFTVVIQSVNDLPVTADVSFETDEETAYSAALTATDIETAAADLTYAATAQPQHGTLELNADGSYTYTPDDDYFGSDGFTAEVTDADGGTATAVVSVTVNNINDAPVAADDTAATDEDTACTIYVLANDTDADGDALSIVSVTSPAHGTAVISEGAVVYTPAENWNGTDSFSCTVQDPSGAADTAAVTVTVTAVDDPPADGDDAYTILEDAAAAYYDVLANDDVDALAALNAEPEALTLISVTPEVPATSAICEVSGNRLYYKPAANFNGTDVVNYVMRDSDTELTYTFAVTFTVTSVNDRPTISNIADSDEAEEDTPFTAGFTVGDVETAAADLVVTTSYTNPALIASVTVSGSGADRTVTVTPKANMYGTTTVTVTVKDGSNATAYDRFTVTFQPVEDEPTPGLNADTAVTDENTAVYIDVLANDDVDLLCADGDDLEIVSVTGEGGTYEIEERTVTETYTDASGVTRTRTVARDVIKFTPDADWTSAVEQTFTASYVMREADNADNTYAATDMLRVTVTPVNDAPVITVTPTEVTVDEDNPAAAAITVGDEETAAADLTVTVVSVVEADNSYTPDIPLMEADDITITAGATDDARVLTATPNADESGTVTVTVRVSDGVKTADAVLVITVTPVQDEPADGDDEYTVAEDSSTLFNVLANDDVDTTTQTETVSLTAITAEPSHGTAVIENGQIRYEPEADYYGADSFAYSMQDDGGNTGEFTVSVTVTPVNDAPVIAIDDDTLATPEATPITFYVTVTDVDDDLSTLTMTAKSSSPIVVMSRGIVITGPVVAGSVATFTVTATPYLLYNGVTNINLTAWDTATAAANSAPAVSRGSVQLTVTSVNNAPEPAVDALTGSEGETKTLYVLANDTDPDLVTNPADESLTVRSVSYESSETNSAAGTLTVSADGTAVVFTPAAGYTDFNGVLHFKYTVEDAGGLTAEQTGCTYTIAQVNDAPVAGADTAETDEDTAVTFDIFSNDYDVDMDAALNASPGDESISITANGFAGLFTNGTVTATVSYNAATGELTYTPAANFNGTDEFTYTLTDGTVSVTGSITVTVNPVNDAPTAVDDTAATAEDTPVTVDVTANDSDTDSDTTLNLDGTAINDGSLTVNEVSAPEHGTARIVSNKILYTPNANWYGTDTFTYIMENEDGEVSGTATVTVTVSEVNDTPVANADSAETDEDTAVTFDILGNDTDVDTANAGAERDTLSVVANGFAGSVTGSSLSYNAATGELTYTPAANWNGTDEFTYTLTDGTVNVTGNITVTVNAVNDAPVAANATHTMPEDSAAWTIDLDTLITDVEVSRGEAETLTVTIISSTDAANTSFDAATNRLTYAPVADWNGVCTVTYRVTDSGALYDQKTVTITVTQVNDAPVAGADTAETPEDETVTLPLMANDYDVDMDAALNASVEGAAIAFVAGGITGNEPGSTAAYDADTDTLTYTPAPGFVGTDVFTYTVTDGTLTTDGTVTINVTAADYTIRLEPESIDFGSVNADYTRAPAWRTVTIRNVGNKTVTIDGIALDNYEIEAATPIVIPAFGEAAIRIRPLRSLRTGEYDAVLTVTTTENTSDETAVLFKVANRYRLTVTAGEGGSVSPESGSYRGGRDAAVTITAAAGYVISDVLIDGVSVGAVTEYVFTSLDASHTVEAVCAAIVPETTPGPAETAQPGGTEQPGETAAPETTPEPTTEPAGTHGDGDICVMHILTAVTCLIAAALALLLRKKELWLRMTALAISLLLMLLFTLLGSCRLDWPVFAAAVAVTALTALIPPLLGRRDGDENNGR